MTIHEFWIQQSTFKEEIQSDKQNVGVKQETCRLFVLSVVPLVAPFLDHYEEPDPQ